MEARFIFGYKARLWRSNLLRNVRAAPCGNQKPSPDHIHTFYRDPTNDYGAKLMKR